MPYSLKGNCVIKTDSGETVKCHATHAEAMAHLRALEVNVMDAKDMGMMDGPDMPSQEETNYVTVSPKTGEQQCANCRFYVWANMMQDGDGKAKMGTSSCALIECYPEPILPTGYCDRWEVDPPESTEVEPIPVTIVDMEFASTDAGMLETAVRKLTGKPLPGYTMTKNDDGRRLMVIFTSNGYKDREFEHVATKALAEYVDSQWKGDGWNGDNVHLLWHLKQLGPIGDIVWAGMIEGFLVEIAKERDHLIAKTVWDFIEAHPELDWGASHGFKVRQMADKDTYSEIRKFETSSLPRAFAAHPLTYSGVVKMVDAKKDPKAALLDEMFHIEDVAGLLANGGPKALNEALAKVGVEAKELKEGETQTEPVTPAPEAEKPVDFSQLMTELIGAQARVLEQLQSLSTQVGNEATARATLESAVKSQLAAMTADNDKLKAQLALAPRSVSRDIAGLTPVPAKDVAAIKENLPQEGSPFWLGAVPPEKR
jgi:hypothetical protein